MKTFENFIESEAFFPVLILLLVMLVCVFMWIILSNKKEEQKRRSKKNIKIDEDAEIKIVSDGNDDLRVRRIPAGELDDVDEPERSEIAIIEEVKDSTPFVNFSMKPKEDETIYDIPLPNFNEGRFTETEYQEEEIQDNEIDYGDLSVPVVPDIFKEKGENGTNNVDFSNAFSTRPNGDTEINEDIKVEEMNEYVGEKTEVFDFPAFDDEDIFSSGDIETEIINAAENYIKDIMSK